MLQVCLLACLYLLKRRHGQKWQAAWALCSWAKHCTKWKDCHRISNMHFEQGEDQNALSQLGKTSSTPINHLVGLDFLTLIWPESNLRAKRQDWKRYHTTHAGSKHQCPGTMHGNWSLAQKKLNVALLATLRTLHTLPFQTKGGRSDFFVLFLQG
jgi:hypothetical protein